MPIGRSPSGKLAFGSGSIVEWAVRIHRFEQAALLSNLAQATGISNDLARLLADVVYACHQTAQRALPPSGMGVARGLVDCLSVALSTSEVFAADDVALVLDRFGQQLFRSAGTLDQRANGCFVRRCHGDLHLANIVMWQGRPVPYDAIEFDEAIATIDTLYDLAFLLMDLDRYDQRAAANIVLNRYMWRGRDDFDLKGLVALPLFLALRAIVRGIVTADRAAQKGAAERKADIECARCYLCAALEYAAPAPAQLIAIGGLSGTGKTTLAATIAPWVGDAPGAVHIRSDLERKALAGIGEFDSLPARAYTSDARKQVYAVLREKVSLVLATGHSVILDAVFAEPDERHAMEALAVGLGVPWRGIWLKAEPERLITRVASRRNDASEATPDIVLSQLKTDPGSLAPGWSVVGAGGTALETLDRVRAILGISIPKRDRGTPECSFQRSAGRID
jgi:aminoglycoside phosphotransferase family enzyme/predicted kinase